MAEKPNHIALPPRIPGSMTPGSGSRGGSPLHSPRIPFVTGEGTPAMSPLDAFAAQSRLLARQLDDESKRVGRRVSRLPHDQVAEHLSRRQRHLSPRQKDGQDESGFSPVDEELSGERPEIENVPPEFRPKSFYPRLSAVTASPEPSMPNSPRDDFMTPQEATPPGGGYFAGQRAASPEPSIHGSVHDLNQSRPSLESTSQSSYARSQSSFDSNHRPTDLHRGLSIESSQSSRSMYANHHQNNSLLPPNPPYARKSPSIRSVDSDSESVGSRNIDGELRRRTSFGSGMSGPISPVSPHMRGTKLRRTPSQTSEMSLNTANRMSRPNFNFSRPMSRQDKVPSRMSSIDSHAHPRAQDPVQTPTSIYEPLTPASFVTDTQSLYDESLPRQSEESGGTYTHATYSLPRGRMISRDSVPLDSLMPQFSWEQGDAGGGGGSSSSNSNNASNISHQKQTSGNWLSNKSNRSPYALPTPPRESELTKAQLQDDMVRPSIDSTRSVPVAPVVPAPPPASHNHSMNRHSMTSMSAASMNSGSTIKASSHKKQKSDGELTIEDHLAKGIACHEKGSLNESTYHLRIAANGGNSTAMMLYALACRHGWGMRQNPSEGVLWLRKAMDCANIEMSDESNDTNLTPAEKEAKKQRKAQFALSVYELGNSHMNGWGIEQDKALALKCYEIAASWGDADAMAETGFCYAQGVGCKKDLKKAAQYYRQAEKKGMSMVGQSWIYKSKYDEDPAAGAEDDRKGRSDRKDDKKKGRDKSRTRSIFGRKRN